MTGYVTVCYSDQTQDTFQRGVMKMKNGVRTEKQIRRVLEPEEKEGAHFYLKPDPNFENWTYSICHIALRKVLKPKDILFFRTLWRNTQYFIGYFVISHKSGDPDNPICQADSGKSLLIKGYRYVITSDMVKILNPNADFSRDENRNRLISSYLSRYYLSLSPEKTLFLKSELDKFR
jgi:hypothetical protein